MPVSHVGPILVQYNFGIVCTWNLYWANIGKKVYGQNITNMKPLYICWFDIGNPVLAQYICILVKFWRTIKCIVGCPLLAQENCILVRYWLAFLRMTVNKTWKKIKLQQISDAKSIPYLNCLRLQQICYTKPITYLNCMKSVIKILY